MPKIDVFKNDIDDLLLKKLDKNELEDVLASAKAELKELSDDGIYKIELNDTNRPDLWTSAGLARQINQFLKLKKYNYPFFEQKIDAKFEIIVDKRLQNIRPYIVGFGVKNINITEELLLELIQNQEKLCTNFGRARKDVAIGIYKFEKIKFPVYYKAIKPSDIKFVPLEFDNKMDLNEILEKHPKGIEFGHIVKDFELYPIIVDSNNEVLSFPPIINSKYIGEVEVGDKEIFVEITGSDLKNLALVANLLACDLYDRGAEILPIKVKFPYQTPYGKEIVLPFCFNNKIEVPLAQFKTLLGEIPDKNEIEINLKKMGYNKIKFENEKIECVIPNYRQDIMHPVDVIEDFAIGKGYDNFKPEMPSEFTVGTLSKIEILSDKVRDIMVGQGFQEIISNILNSSENIYFKMNNTNSSAVEIANPMTESYNLLRNSIIPSLLEVESISAKAEYPHKIFEIGEIALKDPKENYGTKTLVNLGILSSNPRANFSEMRSCIDSLFYYLNIDDYQIKESERSFLISGRTAEIIVNNNSIGYFGEVHPEILQRWDINMPCVVAELTLDSIIK